jgi:nicotinamidase-related amidase
MRRPGAKAALLLVDFMNPLDFPGSRPLAPDALRAARATAALRTRLRRRRVPVIYANDNFGHWNSEFSTVVDQCRQRGGPSAEIAEILAPDKADFSILKPRHSAFFGTPLEFLLDDLSIGTLIVTGIAADSCISFTALHAYLHRYRLWIPADCVAAESAALKRAALSHLARVTKAEIAPSTADLGRLFAKLAKVKL